jgi:hypothetical protein
MDVSGKAWRILAPAAPQCTYIYMYVLCAYVRTLCAALFLAGWHQGWAKLVLIALERYSVALKRLTFNLH